MASNQQSEFCIYLGEALAAYGFGDGHPFSRQRHDVFKAALEHNGLLQRCDIVPPVMASVDVISRFHTKDYIARVQMQSKQGIGFLDYGDTPAFKGAFEAAANVVGSVVDGVNRIMQGEYRRVFVPIAGLHHARRDSAAGFCVFNDCGVAIETLLGEHALQSVAYIDIDAHHGDGVFYAFEDNPALIFADTHQYGNGFYPGTGQATESGMGKAAGSKLNIPLPSGAGDEQFMHVWPQVEALLAEHQPEFILLQCGADSIAGDPITGLAFSAKAHTFATGRLRELAEQYCEGRILAMGGGGYNLENIATAWTAVADVLSDDSAKNSAEN